MLIKRFPTFAVILSGLCTAQILATIQVYISNLKLHQKLIALSQAGYVTVPGKAIMPGLKGLGPAFWGGLFFTLTIGSGLTLLTFAVIGVRKYSFRASKYVLALFIVIMGIVLFGINVQGPSPVVSLYFLLIPLVVASLHMKYSPNQPTRGNRLRTACHITAILVLAILWGTQLNSQMFLNVRDNILLSNPVGIAINDFYYKYTMYASEVFKSLDQKTMRLVSVPKSIQPHQRTSLEKTLLRNNYLVVENAETYDLKILNEGDFLIFVREDHRMMKPVWKDFLRRPPHYLNEFSKMTDNHSLFRRLVYLSLLTGFPVMLYIMLHGFIYFSVSLFLRPTPSFITATALCFLIGLTLLLPVYAGHDRKINNRNLSAMLASDNQQETVAALKAITAQRLEIQDYPIIRRLAKSPSIPVRYRLARALGVSLVPETYPDLLNLMNDPQLNVSCQAVYGLGQRGDAKAIKQILNRMHASEHWYFQWYAYNALRALGWNQIKPD